MLKIKIKKKTRVAEKGFCFQQMIHSKSHSVTTVECDSWQNFSCLHPSDWCHSSLLDSCALAASAPAHDRLPPFCVWAYLIQLWSPGSHSDLQQYAGHLSVETMWRVQIPPTGIALSENLSREILMCAPLPCLVNSSHFWKITRVFKYYKPPLPLRPRHLWMQTEALQFFYMLMF